jgi:membrane protein
MASNATGKLRQLHDGTRAFLNEEDLASGTNPQAPWWRRTAWVLRLIVKSFVRNRCLVRASALAYTTLLALVPLLAVAIGVSTSLLKTQEGQNQVKEVVDRFVANVAPQLDLEFKSIPRPDGGADASAPGDGGVKTNRREVADKIFGFINNIQSGTLGTTGVIGLIIVAISLLSTIEAAFNDIWGVARGRSWTMRIVFYWAAITLGPLIFLVAIGLTTGQQFEATKHWVSDFPIIGRILVSTGISLLPYVVLSLAFWAFYQLIPNTKVHWQAALVGGIVGGCLWQLNSKFNVLYVSKVVTYSKIYGSFALLPVFLIGLYFSWLILLFGAQVAYSFQNRELYRQSRLAENISQQGREFIAVRLMACIGARFQNGDKAWSLPALASCLDVPARLIWQILHSLVQAGLLQETNSPEPTYVPARPLRQISCDDVVSALRVGATGKLPGGHEPTYASVRREFERLLQAEHHTAGAINLETFLAERPPATRV